MTERKQAEETPAGCFRRKRHARPPRPAPGIPAGTGGRAAAARTVARHARQHRRCRYRHRYRGRGHLPRIQVATKLTGWTPQEATGRPLDQVFSIVNEETRRSAENPVHRVLREGVVVGLANHTVLRSPQRFGNSDRGFRGADSRRGRHHRRGRDGLPGCDRSPPRRQAQLHLASIVESSDDAIIGEGLDGTIQSWNAAASGSMATPRAEVIGRPLAMLSSRGPPRRSTVDPGEAQTR